MRVMGRLAVLGIVLATATAVAPNAGAQSPPPQRAPTEPAVVPDEDATLVVATHFVPASAKEQTPRAKFADARISLDAFNKTDHCIDERALELAREYFTVLGRGLTKAGYYYILPDADIQPSVESCEKLNREPPKAWISGQTTVIAFGRLVPSADAPELEKSLR